jgi:23S rRNA (adenine2503-C2)-methyltransferase
MNSPSSPEHFPNTPFDLLQAGVAELTALMKEWGQPAFRAKQIYRNIWVNLVPDVMSMTDLPLHLRERMASECSMGSLRLMDVKVGDGGLTRKAVFALPGGEPIEAVLMVYPGRATVCVSSQAGCPMGCVFCATAKLGFLQDLTHGDIALQALWAAREVRKAHAEFDPTLPNRHRVDAENFPQRLSHIVFMGMGEPFNNYDNWWRSVERLHDPDGFNLGARSFTVSTVGLIPGIKRLQDEPLQVNLAISLHSADDATRSAMMPVNRKYPIRDLIAAAREYADKTRRRVSFEYVLLQGKNDTPEEADALVRALRSEPGLLCHVNLIPWNPVGGEGLARSTRERVNAFRDRLERQGVPATIRIQRGVDIDAACGQLAGKYVKQET